MSTALAGREFARDWRPDGDAVMGGPRPPNTWFGRNADVDHPEPRRMGRRSTQTCRRGRRNGGQRRTPDARKPALPPRRRSLTQFPMTGPIRFGTLVASRVALGVGEGPATVSGDQPRAQAGLSRRMISASGTHNSNISVPRTKKLWLTPQRSAIPPIRGGVMIEVSR